MMMENTSPDTLQLTLQLEIERLRKGLQRLSKSTVLQFPHLHVPNEQSCKCLQAIKASNVGYQKQKQTKGRKERNPAVVLLSNFDLERNTTAPEKLLVDQLIAKRAFEIFGSNFVDEMIQQNLSILLLDAPNIATTRTLISTYPSLAQESRRIIIPQADPSHYSIMINDPDLELMLNIRSQRLDQWLCSNQNIKPQLQIPIFFADYETTVYGKPSYNFQPLVDMQRFLRYGYAYKKGCLLGLTLSFRTPNSHFYSKDAPILTPEDVVEFITKEAKDQNMKCTVLDVVRYGMTFLLFHLQQKVEQGEEDERKEEGEAEEAVPVVEINL